MIGFPDDFLWGASTAAYQVEGGLHTQWSEWENANAERLAQGSPKKLGWLPRTEHLAGQWDNPQNYIAGNGVEHYERYHEDFDILQSLGMNAFRFGIEWARVEPEEGQWDATALAHYREYIADLKKRGVEPVLNIWHWTMPMWFVRKGAFEKRANVRYFERFVEKLAQTVGSDIRYVLPLNEPNVYMTFSYMIGEWPPARKRPLQGLRVYANLAHAHRRAYQVWKRHCPTAQVGIAMNLSNTKPVGRSPINKYMANCFEYAWNWYFLNRIRPELDFIGVNHYFTEYRDWLGRLRNPKEPVSDLGWYMEPAAIEDILTKTWRRYHKPLLITENGLADAADVQRQWWLEQTLVGMEQAMKNGVKLIGYLHWSLLDNFEWAYGWWPKFGLVVVDRTTMKRTIRPSAKWFAARIEKARHGA